jgi:hypothetical protein
MSSAGQTLAALRRFAQARPVEERCELCAASIGEPHEHLYEPVKRTLMCACKACGLLFPETGEASYRRLVTRTPTRCAVAFEERDWALLDLPVRLAFLMPSQVHARLFVSFPNARGATESQLPLDRWNQLCGRHPALASLLPELDVLALDARQAPMRSAWMSVDLYLGMLGRLRGASLAVQAWQEFEQALRDCFGAGHD